MQIVGGSPIIVQQQPSILYNANAQAPPNQQLVARIVDASPTKAVGMMQQPTNSQQRIYVHHQQFPPTQPQQQTINSHPEVAQINGKNGGFQQQLINGNLFSIFFISEKYI